MKPVPGNESRVLCADLLAPEGYGEVIGGSERETDYDKLLDRIKSNGLNPDDYAFYLDLRKYRFGASLRIRSWSRTYGNICSWYRNISVKRSHSHVY